MSRVAALIAILASWACGDPAKVQTAHLTIAQLNDCAGQEILAQAQDALTTYIQDNPTDIYDISLVPGCHDAGIDHVCEDCDAIEAEDAVSVVCVPTSCP